MLRFLPSLAALAALAATAAAADRPNIVFIFSDDHAYQAISAYGDPEFAASTDLTEMPISAEIHPNA